MEIGQKIRRGRQSRKLSLEALGKLVGVSRSAVHQWENGQVTNITLANRLKLSEALGISIVELLPPEATAGEVTIRDPDLILANKVLGELSEPRREAYLRLLLVMRDEDQLGGQSG